MPALSKTQQRLMGQAYGVRKFMDTKGKEGIDPDTIDSKYREEIVDIAKGMKKKALKDFASTKHKGLPEEVEESETPVYNEKMPFIWSQLEPDSKEAKKRGKLSDLQNLVDYRTFLNKRKK